MSLKPLEVVTEKISPIDIGKYYLKIEFNKLFAADELRTGIEKTIDELDEYDFWRLLEALSLSFRLNGIFWAISNTKYSWSEEIWSPEDITYVQMRPSIDKITFSPEINGNPIKFKEYLIKYFSAHPHDDPEELEQFRPNPTRTIHYGKLFIVEDKGKMNLLDGGNRLIAGLMRKQEKITAYIGRKTTSEEKFRIGDSTFWLLGRLYNTTAPENKDAVLKTIELLINLSVDGKQAIRKYWLPNIKSPELKKKCEDLINK